MTTASWFIYAVATLEGGACFSYIMQRQWRLAIVWAGISLSNFAFAGVRGQ